MEFFCADVQQLTRCQLMYSTLRGPWAIAKLLVSHFGRPSNDVAGSASWKYSFLLSSTTCRIDGRDLDFYHLRQTKS